jgi:hypothetical protein
MTEREIRLIECLRAANKCLRSWDALFDREAWDMIQLAIQEIEEGQTDSQIIAGGFADGGEGTHAVLAAAHACRHYLSIYRRQSQRMVGNREVALANGRCTE